MGHMGRTRDYKKQAGIGAARRVNHRAATRGAGRLRPGKPIAVRPRTPAGTWGQGQLSRVAPCAWPAVEAKSMAARPQESASWQTAPADDGKVGTTCSTPGCNLLTGCWPQLS